MILSSEDLQEIRIFRSRLIRIAEHKIECPTHLSKEITTIVTETVNITRGSQDIFRIDNSIIPVVRYLINKGVEIEKESFFKTTHYDRNTIMRLIDILE